MIFKNEIGTVRFHDETIPENEKDLKNNISHFYDVVNQIANNLQERKIDISNLFYSSSELSKIELDHSELCI